MSKENAKIKKIPLGVNIRCPISITEASERQNLLLTVEKTKVDSLLQIFEQV